MNEPLKPVCKCGCHDPRNAIMHYFPCCHRCPICRDRIRVECGKRHAETCSIERFDEIGVYLDTDDSGNISTCFICMIPVYMKRSYR